MRGTEQAKRGLPTMRGYCLVFPPLCFSCATQNSENEPGSLTALALAIRCCYLCLIGVRHNRSRKHECGSVLLA